MNRLSNLETYRADALAEGYDEVLERRWAAGAVAATYSHPFDVAALLVEGEMWLEQGPIVVHLVPGSEFALKANVLHAERYGPEGALFFSARRHAKDLSA